MEFYFVVMIVDCFFPYVSFCVCYIRIISSSLSVGYLPYMAVFDCINNKSDQRFCSKFKLD